MLDILVYLAAGAVAGLLSGLFGIGGGVIIVPVLLALFALREVPASVIMHMAVGTSLATIVFTAISSVRSHWRRGGVLVPVFLRLAAGMCLGSVLGALIAGQMSGALLKAAFGVFLLALGLQLAFGRGPRPGPRPATPSALILAPAGSAIGAVSSLLGIAGGAMTVPLLARLGIPMRQAVGTSAACGLPIALVGAAAFMATGFGHPDLPQRAIGYVYWPAFLGIIAMSLFTAPLGARLAHRLPQHILQRAFALLLIVLGLNLLRPLLLSG
ncbi:sulfite exporter TauE/SafE family protein [Alkalilimnicola ehrlichii MLHE-1]|uniref:Probable membrane transporter protein n=1 Tax=Alkalilimnicola ehrlichii (strain ATCC BAA-1101 / DSM 17681 / MLHE-1) TaxID=187272 RepID=Q0ACQ0_ALKEH|nr:sulfite exporter TauE/SafE family protein [Alkalilimnicola ehrlichii]ABI55387.1 protein of unknown function DUF81 [Alkalilimnicola ehrlichii MLHE-1]